MMTIDTYNLVVIARDEPATTPTTLIETASSLVMRLTTPAR